LVEIRFADGTVGIRNVFDNPRCAAASGNDTLTAAPISTLAIAANH
jgi:hypothetical protein